MSAREWKPGEVAVTAKGALAIRQGGRWIDSHGAPWSDEKFATNLRPLVVIDPEDREQVANALPRLREQIEAVLRVSVDDRQWERIFGSVQDDLLALANPQPPKVLEHYPARTDESGVITSLCGKVWRPKKATILGRCSECEAVVASGWVS